MHSCISHTGIEQEKDFTRDAVPSMYAAMSHCMRVCWRPAENCAKFRWPQKKIISFCIVIYKALHIKLYKVVKTGIIVPFSKLRKLKLREIRKNTSGITE